MTPTPGFGGQQAWTNTTSYKAKRKDKDRESYKVKDWHRKALLQQEHRGKAETHQNKSFAYTHTLTNTFTSLPAPDIYIRRGRAQWACGGIAGWGGEVGLSYWEVVNTVRQYLHGSPRTALRHLSPLHLVASPIVFPKPSTLTAAPQMGPLALPASLAVQHSRCAHTNGLGWLDP